MPVVHIAPMREGGINKMMNIAVLGASGVVGKEVLSVLDKTEVKFDNLRLLASPRSAGVSLTCRGEKIKVEAVNEKSFDDIQIAIFVAGEERSREWVDLATSKGAVVIDNSSAFRMEEDVPLVVPEINSEDIALYRKRNIIANPNCSTIQMVLPLAKIKENYGLKRIIVSTYQSVSGAGQDGCEELSSQTLSFFNQKDCPKGVFPREIAFNCIPQIGDILENGYTKEEMKMVYETQKIFHESEIQVIPTTVRVPVFNCHSLSVSVETHSMIEVNKIAQEMTGTKGVQVMENPGQYQTHLECAGKNDVYVSRLRSDFYRKNAFTMWSVTDNLRKGAALNAWQIAEVLMKKHL